MTKKEAQVAAAARDALVKVASERDEAFAQRDNALAKLAAIELRITCEKVAAEMHEKGINTDRDFLELVGDLEKSASRGKLPVIQEAVAMTAPNMGTKIASLNHDVVTSGGTSQFEQYLFGSVG